MTELLAAHGGEEVVFGHDRATGLRAIVAIHSTQLGPALGGTRFLVITHHRLTMARMDRLFGVTMPERGASHLVSVDLRRAEVLRQTA